MSVLIFGSEAVVAPRNEESALMPGAPGNPSPHAKLNPTGIAVNAADRRVAKAFVTSEPRLGTPVPGN